MSLEFSPQGGLPLVLGAALIGRKIGSTGMGERAKGSGLGHLNRKTLPPSRDSHPTRSPGSCQQLRPGSLQCIRPGHTQAGPGYRLSLGVSYSATRSVTLSRLIFSCQALDHFLLCWSFSARSTTGLNEIIELEVPIYFHSFFRLQFATNTSKAISEIQGIL